MTSHDAEAIISVDPGSGPETQAARRIDRLIDTPFSVLVVGDFSGQDLEPAPASDGASESWSIIRVESPDELMERLRPRVLIESERIQGTLLELRRMEDFHPDRLLERFPPLQAMMRAIDAVDAAPTDTAAERSASYPPAESSGRELLDEILAKAPDRPAPADDLDGWVRRVVAPHTIRGEGVGQAEARKGLADEAEHGLRQVLRAPPLRRLEATWRDLTSLAAAVGQAKGCRVYVLDVSRVRLEHDLLQEDLEASRLLDLLLEPLTGTSTPPALIVGAYTLGPSLRDLALANRLAMLASLVGSPWISGADPSLVGITDLSSTPGDWESEQPEPEVWAAFRATPASSALGLATPAVLARPAYGQDWEPCRGLAGFEEVKEGGGSSGYVWGNPAFLCAAVAVERFGRAGWAFDPHERSEVSGLFNHILPDGTVGAHPTRELLTTHAAEVLTARGLMAILAHREEARAIVPGLRPVADAGAAPAAWWNGLRPTLSST